MSLQSSGLRKRRQIVILALIFILFSAFTAFSPVTVLAAGEGQNTEDSGEADPEGQRKSDDSDAEYNSTKGKTFFDYLSELIDSASEQAKPLVRYEDDEEEDGEGNNPIADYLKGIVQSTLDAVLDNTGPTDYVNIMLGRQSGFYETVQELGKNLSAAVKVFASSFLFIYVLEELIKQVAKAEEYKGAGIIDIISRSLIKLSIGFLLLLYIDDIMKAVEDFGAYLVEYMEVVSSRTIFENTATVLTVSMRNLKVTDYMAAIPKILSYSLLYHPLAWILKISVKTMSYAIFFELAVRKIFMPLAIVNIVSSPSVGSSPGIRYLKHYFAIYIRMIIIIVTIVIANALLMATTMRVTTTIDAAGNWSWLFYDVVCLRTASLAVMRAGMKYSNEVLGVK